MRRNTAILFPTVLAVAFGLAVSTVFAQAPASSAPHTTTATNTSNTTDLILRIATLAVISGGLIGTFAILTSLRASAFSQMYGRFQTLLLKFADNPELFDRLKKDEYTDAENDPMHPNAVTTPHRFVANCMVNMYEEAFLLHKSRVLRFIPTVPEDYWLSMLGSMRAAFQLRYVRTHWEKRQAVFSASFNRFVKAQIIGYTGVNPAPDVV